MFTPGFLAMTLSENWDRNRGVMREWRKMALYYVACRGGGRGTVRVFPFTGETVVRYRLSRLDQVQLCTGLAHLSEALFAAGARRLYPALRSPDVLNSPEESRKLRDHPVPLVSMGLTSVHAFSTCPMGEDESACATNSFGQVRGFSNLYVSDASLIPDSLGANPQGTIMALSLRNARQFIRQNDGKNLTGS